jgi:hypothetical protein
MRNMWPSGLWQRMDLDNLNPSMSAFAMIWWMTTECLAPWPNAPGQDTSKGNDKKRDGQAMRESDIFELHEFPLIIHFRNFSANNSSGQDKINLAALFNRFQKFNQHLSLLKKTIFCSN